MATALLYKDPERDRYALYLQEGNGSLTIDCPSKSFLAKKARDHNINRDKIAGGIPDRKDWGNVDPSRLVAFSQAEVIDFKELLRN